MNSNPVALRRPAVLTLGIGVMLLIILGAMWWSLTGDREAATAVASSDGEILLAQESDDEAGEQETVDAVALEVTYDVFLTRDPFESIRPPEPVSVDDPANGDPTTDPSANDAPDDDVPTNGVPTTDTPDDDVDRTDAEAVRDGIVVVLDTIVDGTAVIEVNGVPYAVEPGDTFAVNFTLLRIDGACVDILFMSGDEADAFSLCLGVGVSK